ncbi:MAG: glucuronate isomerase [Acidobacteria bacterium]|nr:MAG: glucuronate isomerase [Acidobacteriota bacterium]
MLNPDRYFDPDPTIRSLARRLYMMVKELPLVCPHGHVDPRLLAENAPFPNPAELIIIPDHYIFRMFYSQGIPLESLGIPRRDGGSVEQDQRKIWQKFGENFHLFRGTPTSCWLKQEFEEVFGIQEPLNAKTAMTIYDQIGEKLSQPEFLPRALYERFNIEVLVTTDSASDSLEYHRKIRESGWKGRVIPTFRPDKAVNILQPGWKDEIEQLGRSTGREIASFEDYVKALEERRRFFISTGATTTDHAVVEPYAAEMSRGEVDALFDRALRGEATEEDACLFTAHMLMEFARMSVDDGMVMQLHAGSFRNHNDVIFEKFGPDKGCDIPVACEFTRNLRALLNKYGNEPGFRLILFTLDESTYSRELAPMAGHYPAVKLGPAWWFHDSREGMTRFRRRTTETAGIYNTVGFNDDTRAFPSIPARHDLARRIDCNFLGTLAAEHVIEEDEAQAMAVDLARNLVKAAYKL